jgi:hypothetical protein
MTFVLLGSLLAGFDLSSLVGVAVVSLGGGVGISYFVARWLADRAATRIELRWRSEYDRDLARLNSELATTRGLLQTSLNSASQARQAAQERILRAVETLWATMVELRDQVYPVLFIYEVLLPEEYPKALSNPSSVGLAKVDTNEFSRQNLKIGKKPEWVRPFLGEDLWTPYWAYRAVVGRLCLKVLEGRDKGEIPPWEFDADGERDEYTIKLLRLVLSEEEINLIPPSIAVPDVLMGLCERRILLEMERRISGRHIAEASIEEGQRLRDVVQKEAQERRERSLGKT